MSVWLQYAVALSGGCTGYFTVKVIQSVGRVLVESVSTDSKPEPPDQTVVIDVNGVAWQRYHTGYWYKAGHGRLLFWSRLNDERGPITEIWRPNE